MGNKFGTLDSIKDATESSRKRQHLINELKGSNAEEPQQPIPKRRSSTNYTKPTSSNQAHLQTPGQDGNICESCEVDKQLSHISSNLIKDEPCWEEYLEVQKCMNEFNNQISKCKDPWALYRRCRLVLNTMSQDLEKRYA